MLTTTYFSPRSLYSLLKKLLIQAHAFRRAASTSDEFDDADFALLGICGDFATAGERFVAAEQVWREREKAKREVVNNKAGEDAAPAAAGGIEGSDEEAGMATRTRTKTRARARARGEQGQDRGKGQEERIWTDREYFKACEELAYGAIELDVKKQCVRPRATGPLPAPAS